MYYTIFKTWLCKMTLVGDEAGISHLYLDTGEGKRTFDLSAEWTENASFFETEIRQIQEYLSGNRQIFEFKLNPQGTEFQKKTWAALDSIPYGETSTYKKMAILVGNERASRAVGTAIGKNPIPLIIPCHRVVGSNGKLTGYAFGLDAKQQILSLEKHILTQG